MRTKWIGVDFDGTLVIEDASFSPYECGAPIPKMIRRVKAWLAQGKEVRIFTARLTNDDGRDVPKIVKLIEDWCIEHIGQKLKVTNMKDHGLIELWDDRAVGVLKNIGKRRDLRVPIPREKIEYAWECNECGSQEYTMSVSEEDVEKLGCSGCGASEWHKAVSR